MTFTNKINNMYFENRWNEFPFQADFKINCELWEDTISVELYKSVNYENLRWLSCCLCRSWIRATVL